MKFQKIIKKILSFILLVNFIFLFINLYFIFCNKVLLLNEVNNKYLQIFKNIDLFGINMTIKPYSYISFYLNSKYKIKANKSFQKENAKKYKKTIRLYSVGSRTNFFQNRLRNNVIEGLQDKFNFEFTFDNPDYLIYDIFNCDFLNSKYNNTIKIAFFTENQIPDFNQADYAIGFQNINYLDRYFRKTTLIWVFQKRYLNIKNKDFMKKRKEVYRKGNRKKFCAAVISNSIITDGFRIKFINELNKYKKVDMGGAYNNNIGKPVKDKIKFLSSYKFSIAMENTEGQGYISEKILDSFIAGTIPIYYGGYMIDEFINPKSFILIKNEKDMKEKIEYIKKIDNNEKLYKNILKENLFINDDILEVSKKENIKFFNNIFEQDKNNAKRIDRYHSNLN